MKLTLISCCVGLAMSLNLMISASGTAATSFSNSLTGFTGDSSQSATQNAVAAAGFNFFSTQGFTEDPPGNFFDPRVEFDAAGARFGAQWTGDGGRNYMRTNDDDYANFDFTAEVTMVVPGLDTPPFQSGWLGMGAGDTALFGWPDWSTQFSSVMVVPEKFDSSNFFTTMYTDNDTPIFANNEDPVLTNNLANGTHRMRLTLNRGVITTTATFSIDLNYAGGAFVSDYSAPTLDISALYGPDGWSTEPSRIFFGGDDGTIFKDFSVTVTGSAVVFGDLNMDGNITSADWAILRTNQETNLSGLSLEDAYFRGDLTIDLVNDHEDFVVFKSLFDAANGAGSFVAMVNGVPEPSLMLLILSGGLVALVARRKARHYM